MNLRRRRDPLSPQDRRVLASGFFDAAWYLDNNPDLVAVGVTDAAEHYLRWGAAEGRSPGPHFDAAAYRLLNPGAAANPLLHHLTYGAPLGLAPGDVVDAAHPALAGGWFDPAWYRARYAGLIRDDVHPYVDYVWHGASGGRQPSPLFDAAAYAADLATAGHDAPTERDPILAFLNAPRGTGPLPRCVRGHGPHADLGELLAPEQRRPEALERLAGSVCVLLHAWYADVVPELLTALRSLPKGFTLLVAVPDEERIAPTNRLVDHFLGAATTRVVRATSNRGRNFGPMLCEFAGDVRSHELMLHLHTKKSMHTGSERTAWRRHLVRALAGSPAVVNAVLGLFGERADLGVVHPSLFPELPEWVTHWLGNAATGQALFARMGLPPHLAQGYGHYPVGGMFWARTAALAPLFDLALRPEDFEPEPNHNDGLLAHAVERSIVTVARAGGFDAVEFDYEEAQWRLNWTAAAARPLGPTPTGTLDAALGRAKLVSVDLFDTVVLRPTLDPASLQHFAARNASAAAADAEATLAARLAAETAARNAADAPGDVAVADIVAHAGPHAEAVARVLATEAEQEIAYCVPRTRLVEQLRRAAHDGTRVVLMTDTFLPRHTIDALVGAAGAGGVFADVYVSNEARARKDTGTMWSLVAQAEGVGTKLRADEWLHVGDNEFSDVQMAAVRGIPVVHVAGAGAAAQRRGVGTAHLAAHERPASAVVAGSALVHLLAHEPREWWEGHSPAYRLGYCGLGPLVFTFLSWLRREAPARGASRLLFLARDGHLLHRAAHRLRPLTGGPSSHYFLCSRRVALTAAQHRGLDVDLVLGAGEFHGTVAALLANRLGLETGEESATQVVSLPGDERQCEAVLEAHAAEIVERGRREREALARYLVHLGIDDQEQLGLVDLGYSATTQRALAAAVPNPLLGFYCATTPDAERGAAAGRVHACFGDDLTTASGYHGIMYHRLLLEALLAGDHDQVASLRTAAGEIVATGAPGTRRSDEEWASVHEAQEAALQFCVDVVGRAGPAILDEPVDPALGLAPWIEALSVRSEWSESLFRGLRLDNDFTGAGPSPVR